MPGVGTGELQRRELAVLEALAKGMTPRDACLAAGYAATTAAARSQTISERVLKRSPIVAALDRRNVAADQLARLIARGLRSRRVTRLVVDGTVQKFSDADHGARHRFVETALRLRGETPGPEQAPCEETYEQRVRRLRSTMK